RAEGQVAKSVEDDEVGMNQATGDLAASPLILLLLQGVDQIDGREEADALLVVFDGLHAERGGQMGLARARSAHEHHVVGGVDEVTAVELPDQGFIDLAAGEVE